MTLIVAEQRAGKLNRASWEAIAAGQQLAAEGEAARVLIVGASIAGLVAELAQAAVSEVLTIEHPALESYTPEGFVQAVATAIEHAAPRWVVLPHTYQTRDFAPKLAARLRRALLTDCVALKRDGDTRSFIRPMFQGKLAAEVVPEGEPPHLVTIQIGSFRAESAVRGTAAVPVTEVPFSPDTDAIRVKPEAPFQEAKQAVDLSQAERIVSVGRGIKGQEHLELVRKLATALGAELAASRPICDAGWLPMERQVGSSGQTVAPKLYLALGISGAIQHLVGMKGSRTIVAVNKDPDAPIFEVADYGIVGDLFEVVPAMLAELSK
ncbi:MAG: electron transfer flavoprotein subunit alpha/FixB family protein [Acidobacteria bacterium]|nr:MAG: electron transfer flavoprotein subunit alpha/FixB family protein [Acidobacteriota bacterium]